MLTPAYRKQKAADWAEERGNHEALSYITKHDQDKRKWMYRTLKDTYTYL